MKIHYLQHVPFEEPGEIESWAESSGHSFRGSHLYRQDPLPSIDEIDLLVVMGGPMGVNDEDQYDWLKDEKKIIIEAIQKRKYVFGVCLGAQLIAEVLGARVYPNHEKEIGWFSVCLTDQASRIGFLKKIPSPINVLHWHGDTFELPKNAIHLMNSEACFHQAFSYQHHVLALQFHMESTKEGIEALLEHDNPDSLSENPYVQSSHEIRSGYKQLEPCRTFLFQLLNEWTDKRP